MCTNFAFVPLVYFCYPETSNLTLEEVDHLFTGEGTGRKGLSQLAAPSEPVRMSFEAHRAGDEEKDGLSRGQSEGALHVENGSGEKGSN